MAISPARRRFPRYPAQFPLLHKPIAPVPARAGAGWTRNLSEGGACVELAECLRAQAPLRLYLRTDRGAIEIETQVAWAGEARLAGGGVPHGVAFTQIAPDQRQTLGDLVRRRGERRYAEVRFPFEVAVTCHRKGEPARASLQGVTGDVSREGLLLLLPAVLPLGSALDLTLHTPSGPLMAEGQIAWVEPPEGQVLGPPFRHGVRFTAVGWSTLLSLGLLLAEPP